MDRKLVTTAYDASWIEDRGGKLSKSSSFKATNKFRESRRRKNVVFARKMAMNSITIAFREKHKRSLQRIPTNLIYIGNSAECFLNGNRIKPEMMIIE